MEEDNEAIMKQPHFEIIGNKIIVRVHEKVCETAGELLYSSLFREILWMAIEELLRRNSHLLNVFPDREVNERTLGKLIKCLAVLARNEDEINQDDRRACVEFLADRNLFNDFVEYIYIHRQETKELGTITFSLPNGTKFLDELLYIQ